jgi:anti-sigma factor RsiW
MKDPNLHPATETLQSFVENTLDAGDRVVLESHLLGCTECVNEVEEWRSLFAMLSTMPQVAPSHGFANRIMAHVDLPDPWYARLPARVSAQLRTFVPQTTRGWAAAAACLALPLAGFAALAAWLLSKPYMTPQSVVSFTYGKVVGFAESFASGTLSSVLQSDVALFAARGLDSVTSAGVGAAGALIFAVSMATALSAWVLYQNLFRTNAARENRHYATYSF